VLRAMTMMQNMTRGAQRCREMGGADDPRPTFSEVYEHEFMAALSSMLGLIVVSAALLASLLTMTPVSGLRAEPAPISLRASSGVSPPVARLDHGVARSCLCRSHTSGTSI
jgi:hypothetical protein